MYNKKLFILLSSEMELELLGNEIVEPLTDACDMFIHTINFITSESETLNG